MTTFRVLYNGNSTRFRNFESEEYASSEREAVENVYSTYLDENYFPQEDGTIRNCNGNIVAESDDDCIEYDGGYFYAEEVE